METIEQVKKEVKPVKVYKKLSIRRRPAMGLPGSDPTSARMYIGSSLKGRYPLSGLTDEEERKYLPFIIGVSDKSQDWNDRVRNYWNSIRELVPDDADTTGEDMGRVLEFSVTFSDPAIAKKYNESRNFEEICELSKQGTVDDKSIVDYVLFRYCIVYGRVANSYKDLNKSRKIQFFLYSKENEVANAYSKTKLKLKATNKFSEIITESNMVNAMLRLFGQLPEIIGTEEERHMALYTLAEKEPDRFVKYAEDKTIILKSQILRAVEAGIIHRPAHTDSYYYGDNNETLLGQTLDDTVLWFKSATEGLKAEIKSAIKARLDNLDK